MSGAFARARFEKEYLKAHGAEIERERGERKAAARARKGELVGRRRERGAITPEEASRALERLGRGRQNNESRR